MASMRLRERGRTQSTHHKVAVEFETRSDRVRQFVAEEMSVVAVTALGVVGNYQGLTKRQLARLFNAWAVENGGHKMAERKIIDRLTSIDGVVDVRIGEAKTRGLNITFKDEAAEIRGKVAEVDHPALYAGENGPLERLPGVVKNDYRKDGVESATLPLNERQEKLGRKGRFIVDRPSDRDGE
jgi:hypothetical protein